MPLENRSLLTILEVITMRTVFGMAVVFMTSARITVIQLVPIRLLYIGMSLM